MKKTPPPTATIRKTTVMLQDDTLYHLKIAAAEQRMSLSRLLREILADYLTTRKAKGR